MLVRLYDKVLFVNELTASLIMNNTSKVASGYISKHTVNLVIINKCWKKYIAHC